MVGSTECRDFSPLGTLNWHSHGPELEVDEGLELIGLEHEPPPPPPPGECCGGDLLDFFWWSRVCACGFGSSREDEEGEVVPCGGLRDVAEVEVEVEVEVDFLVPFPLLCD